MKGILSGWLIISSVVLMASCTVSHPAAGAGSSTATARGTGQKQDGRWRSYESGKASWYGGRWHGRRTASGERYDQHSMTAAHKKLPFNTRVRVTNLKTGKSCIVRINNRGPYTRGRVIDLSVAAAKEIGGYASGVSVVKLEVQR